mmetsp:Transcript_3767/g.13963  ORF Transcript_3767/g.13963 Transcript_3767/m.13963 type:complete len:261 (+) Transcript_3767:1391-2173(+)
MRLAEHAELGQVQHQLLHLEDGELDVRHRRSHDPEPLLLGQAAHGLAHHVQVAARLLHDGADPRALLADEMRATHLRDHDLDSPLVLLDGHVMARGGARGAKSEPDDATHRDHDRLQRTPDQHHPLVTVHERYRQLLVQNVDHRAAALAQLLDEGPALADDPGDLEAAQQQSAWNIHRRTQQLPQAAERAVHAAEGVHPDGAARNSADRGRRRPFNAPAPGPAPAVAHARPPQTATCEAPSGASRGGHGKLERVAPIRGA